jgi:nifR3 family TIM-barrel protein
MTDLPAPPPHYRQPLRIGPLTLAGRFTLAPLAGYTNYPFRRTVREVGGVGLCTTDLVNARAILEGSSKTMQLLATGPDDRPLGVQIFGGVPAELAGAARWLEGYGATSVDINMGCPVRKVVKTGGGSALLCDTTGGTIKLVRQVVEATKLPVTVKMRLGWDDTQLTAPFFAREFEQAGVAAVTVHGRTREQGFTGAVSHDGIRAVVEAVDRIPVFGNGDVMGVADAARLIAETGCHGVAIGRGALANPWIFRQLQSWVETGDPGPRATYYDRLEVMVRHFARIGEWVGDRRFGCVRFRKVAAWYGAALRMSKADKHKLAMLADPDEFAGLADRLRRAGPPPGWTEWDARAAEVAVPAGPIAHW